MTEQDKQPEVTSVSFNLNERSFTATGDTAFVERMMNKGFDMMKGIPAVASKPVKPASEKKECSQLNLDLGDEPNDSEQVTDTGTNKYEQVGIYSYNSESEKYEISDAVPGKNKRQRMLNIGLLLGIANGGPVFRKEIKEQAIRQSTFDPHNISGTFTGNKCFVRTNPRNSADWSVTLTVQGKKEAAALREQMYSAALTALPK